MKLLAILFFASSVLAEPFIKSCGVLPYNPYGQQMTVSMRVGVLNSWRTILVEDPGVSNMFELKYNASLEAEIKKMKSCKDIVHGLNYRVNSHIDPESRQVLGKVFAMQKDSKIDMWIGEAEVLHPLQTSVAWCDISEVCKWNFTDHKNERITVQINSIDIFGPKSTISYSDFKFGKPGSDCPNGVVTAPCEDNCGLCKLPDANNNGVVSTVEVILIFSIFLIISFVRR